MALDNGGAEAVSVKPVPGGIEEECVSLREASRLLGVCVRTIRREIDRGRLPAFRIGRNLRIKPSELQRYTEREAIVV
jgi:excisionase family DNA binding protein